MVIGRRAGGQSRYTSEAESSTKCLPVDGGGGEGCRGRCYGSRRRGGSRDRTSRRDVMSSLCAPTPFRGDKGTHMELNTNQCTKARCKSACN